MSLRINGIYDKFTMEKLKSLKLFDFGFDFRGRSLNFLQQHLFVDILKEFYKPSFNFYLHYENEPAFMIENMLSEVSAVLSVKSYHNSKEQNLFLEFSGDEDISYMEQFKVPFYFHISSNFDIQKISSSEYLHGIILNADELIKMHDSNSFYSFVKKLSDAMSQSNIGNIILNSSWNSSLPPGVTDFLKINLLSFEISPQVEVGFRSVDMLSLERNIPIIRKDFQLGNF